MELLLPDRVQALWRLVEGNSLSAEEAARQQAALTDEYRLRWSCALLLDPSKSLEEDTIDELLAYFPGATRRQIEQRCREATLRLRDQWQQEHPEDASAIARFYDTSQEYIFDLMWWHTLRDDDGPLAYVAALDFAGAHGCRRHLDFGSGVGSGSILFARAGLDATLADISSTMLDFARWRLEQRGIAAGFIDLKQQPLAAQAFDIITAMDVFEHLADPVSTVDQLAAALTPGGYLFGRFAAKPDPDRPQHIVLDFTPTFDRLAALGFTEVWRDQWLWGHQCFQKIG